MHFLHFEMLYFHLEMEVVYKQGTASLPSPPPRTSILNLPLEVDYAKVKN